MAVGVVGCLLALAFSAARAQADSGSGPKAARRVHETVVVSAIDRATHSVTLQNAEGDLRTIGVPPDMMSFDTLKVGDHVDVDYYESIGLSLMPPGTKSSMTDSSTGGRAAAGVFAAGREVTANVQVVSIDDVMNKVTFKGPKGNVRTVTVYDPAMQKRLATCSPARWCRSPTGRRWRRRSSRPRRRISSPHIYDRSRGAGRPLQTDIERR